MFHQCFFAHESTHAEAALRVAPQVRRPATSASSEMSEWASFGAISTLAIAVISALALAAPGGA